MAQLPPSGNGPESGWEGAWREGRTPWDHGAPAPPLVEYLQQNVPPTGQILVPGSGGGHDARALAEAAPDDARIHGQGHAPLLRDEATINEVRSFLAASD